MASLVMNNRGDWAGVGVLVTGATGAVGSWLCKQLLASGSRVVTFIRDADPQSELLRSGDVLKTTVVNGSLEDFDAVERAINEHEIEIVFHLGAQAIVDTAFRSPLATFESNIRGTYHVLEACRRHADLVRGVVIASSDKAYGEKAELPYTEDMSLEGRYPYEVSKSCADLLAQSYFYTYGLRVAIARCGNIFGGGDLNWSRLVPGTIKSALQGTAPIIRSDGSYLRDYIYVKDAAEAYIALAGQLERDDVRGQAFNFGYEEPVSVTDLVSEILKLTDRDDLSPDIRNTAHGEIRSQYLSVGRAASVLHWTPRYEREKGLRETIDWYREYLRDGGS
jgi:CDP-glucose 4,6-dehydratase